MKAVAVILLLSCLTLFCGAQLTSEIVALNNNTESSVDIAFETRFFSYSTLGTVGLVRVYVTNNGDENINAYLQKCYLPCQTYFTSGEDKDYIDTCTAEPGKQCELVVKPCDFHPLSVYFIQVSSTGQEFSFTVKSVEEDHSNVLTMKNNAYYYNSINTADKFPFKAYKFEMPESDDSVVDVYVKHAGNDGTLNVFITPNKTGDLDCSILDANFGPGGHHFRLTKRCLENITTAETFFLGITSNDNTFHNIPFEARIYTQEDIKYEKIDKEIAIREFFDSPYRSSHFELDLRRDKNNTITTFTLNHPHAEIVSTSRLLVSDEEDPNDLCPAHSCTVTGNEGCSIELESCNREERQLFFISTTPIYSNLTQVPLTFGYTVKEYPILTFSGQYYKVDPSEWSFFELDTEHDFYSSRVIDIDIQPENTELLEVYVTRGGITKGGSCSDEYFTCEGNSPCKGSFALCDFDYNGTSIYLSIRSTPPYHSKYRLNVTEKAHTEIHLNSVTETEISSYETHMYFLNDADEKEDLPGMITLEYVDSETTNTLTLSVVAANESSCPVHASCTVDSVDTICSIPLICIGKEQQPYLKVTTDKKEQGTISYSLTYSNLTREPIEDGKTIDFDVEKDNWFYVEEEYGVNIRYTVSVTDGNAHITMYRDCIELDDVICEENEECILHANRNDRAYGGTYWLRIRPEVDSTPTLGTVDLSVGVANCQNVTTDFCGRLFVDVTGIEVEAKDLLAKNSFEALELTLGASACSAVKDYVCGIHFPVCGELGAAPAICKESCIEAFDQCDLSSTCPYHYCESLPECPIAPEPSKFYGGYIALIIIYVLLAIGLVITTVVIIIKGE